MLKSWHCSVLTAAVFLPAGFFGCVRKHTVNKLFLKRQRFADRPDYSCNKKNISLEMGTNYGSVLQCGSVDWAHRCCVSTPDFLSCLLL